MRASVLAMGIALALAACNSGGSTGTSTGNPNDGSNAPTLPGGRDVGTPGNFPVPSTGEDSGLVSGFSAADVLAFAEGTHEQAIRWHDNMIAVLGPEKGEHEVTITVSYEDGAIRWMTPQTAQSGSGRDLGGPEPAIAPADGAGVAADLPAIGGCMPWLEVDVRVTVKTDGGALDESFDATLRSRNALLATVYEAPKPDKLGGAFAPEQILQPGFELVQLSLQINFTPFGVSGRFDGVFQITRGDSVGAAVGGGEPFADFGRKGCSQYYGAFPVALDEMVEATRGQDVLALVQSAPELAVRWSDGSNTTATMAFTPTQDGACVLLDDYFYDGVTVVIDGELALKTADGKVDARWTASARAELPESGALQQVKLTVERKGDRGTEPEDNGIPGADVSSFDDSYFSFVLALADDGAGGDAASAMGELKVTGFKVAPCAGGSGAPDEPTPATPPEMPSDGMSIEPSEPGGGTAGCRGADMFDVLSGAFTLAQ